MVAKDSPRRDAQLRCGFTQSPQYFFAALGFRFFVAYCLPRLAVHCLKQNHIVVAQTGNRSAHKYLASSPQTYFPHYVARELRIARAPHEAKRLPRFLIGEHVEERRLFQLDPQRLLQGAIKDGLSGRVVEVGEHQRVLFRKGGGWP